MKSKIRAIEELEAERKSGWFHRRYRALKELRRYARSPKAIALYEAFIDDECQTIRHRSLEALGGIGSNGALAVVERAMRHSRADVRKLARRILAEIKARKRNGAVVKSSRRLG